MKRKFHEVINLIVLASPRISSAFLSVIFISVMAHQFSDFHFGFIQIAYSVAMLFLWVADLGSLNLMISERVKKGHEYTQRLWVSRMTRLIMMTLPIGLVCHYYHFQKFSYFIFFACLLDLTADSLISFRQVALAPRLSFWIQLGRKGFQLMGLVVIWGLHIKLTLSDIFFIILIPALLALVIEFFAIGKPSFKPSFSVSKTSLKVWFQSGGTLLASVDLWIIGIHGSYSSILYVSIARRVSNALGIFGATSSVETLHDVGKNLSLSMPVKANIKRAVVITVILDIMLVMASRLWLPIISGRTPTFLSYLIVIIIIGIIPVGVVTSNINSVFIGLQKYRYAAISTYGSSFVYLSWLAIMPSHIGIEWTIVSGSIINLLSELLIQFILIKKDDVFAPDKSLPEGEHI